MREGHQSEIFHSMEFPPECCFTLVFRGRRGNLDLVAPSPEEAQAWIQGMRMLIENLQNMDECEKLDQYPFYAHLVLISFCHVQQRHRHFE